MVSIRNMLKGKGEGDMISELYRVVPSDRSPSPIRENEAHKKQTRPGDSGNTYKVYRPSGECLGKLKKSEVVARYGKAWIWKPDDGNAIQLLTHDQHLRCRKAFKSPNRIWEVYSERGAYIGAMKVHELIKRYGYGWRIEGHAIHLAEDTGVSKDKKIEGAKASSDIQGKTNCGDETSATDGQVMESANKRYNVYDAKGLLIAEMTKARMDKEVDLTDAGCSFGCQGQLCLRVSNERTAARLAGQRLFPVYRQTFSGGGAPVASYLDRMTLSAVIKKYGMDWIAVAAGSEIQLTKKKKKQVAYGPKSIGTPQSKREPQREPDVRGDAPAAEKAYPVVDETGKALGSMTTDELRKRYGRSSGADEKSTCWEIASGVVHLRQYASEERKLPVYTQEPRRALEQPSRETNKTLFAMMSLAEVRKTFGDRWSTDSKEKEVYLPVGTRPRVVVSVDGSKRIEVRHIHCETGPLIDDYLEPFPQETRDYVRSHLHDRFTGRKVEKELAKHPERYKDIGKRDFDRKRVLGLANLHLHHDEDMLEDFMDEAHLFAFDDDAWWVARDCTYELTHLPYAACIVDNVLLYELDGQIKTKSLSAGTDEDEAKRLMAFVENECRVVVDEAMTNSYVAGQRSTAAATVRHARLDSPVTRISLGRTVARHDRGGTHTLHTEHHRRGYWRNQAYGEGCKLHKRIWINPTIVTPGGKPYKIANPKRIHRVSFKVASVVG